MLYYVTYLSDFGIQSTTVERGKSSDEVCELVASRCYVRKILRVSEIGLTKSARFATIEQTV